MQFKVSYALVGLFVLVLSGAWIAISLWLAFGDVYKDYDRYWVFMEESVSGLYVDAPVKYRGVEVGKVREIVLDANTPDLVRVTTDIESYVPIKVDTVATLSVQGLTGIAFVELTGGSTGSPELNAERGKYPVIQSGPSLFVRMDAAISELLNNLNKFTDQAGNLMEPELWDSLTRTMKHAEELAGGLSAQRPVLEKGLADAARFMSNSADISDNLPGLLDNLKDSSKAVELMAQDISSASTDIAGAVKQSGRGIEAFSTQTLPEIGLLVSELRRLASTMDRLGQQIEEEPRVLLYGQGVQAPGPGE